MNKTAVRGLVLAAVASAVLFRAPELRLRPMHHDEANQALKFGALLENGEYRYDKADHHGPSLYYLSLPVAAAAGRKTLASLDETVLRLVPAGFGIGVVLLSLFFAGGMGRSAAAWSAHPANVIAPSGHAPPCYFPRPSYKRRFVASTAIVR